MRVNLYILLAHAHTAYLFSLLFKAKIAATLIPVNKERELVIGNQCLLSIQLKND